MVVLLQAGTGGYFVKIYPQILIFFFLKLITYDCIFNIQQSPPVSSNSVINLLYNLHLNLYHRQNGFGVDVISSKSIFTVLSPPSYFIYYL